MTTPLQLFRSLSLAALCGLLAFVPPSLGQGLGTPLGPVEVGVLEGLQELPDELVRVRYTPGALDRAARLQEQMRTLQEHLVKWSRTPDRQTVLVVSPQEWKQLGIGQRYGFPARLEPAVMAAPAWGTEETVELWQGLAGGELPVAGGFSARGTAEEAASMALADAFLRLELCRAAGRRGDLAGGEEKAWLGDVFAHALCATSERIAVEPPQPALGALLARIAPPELPEELGAYGAGLDGRTWIAYQARLARGGLILWREAEKRAPRRIFKLRKKKGEPLVFEDLLKTFPGLVPWRGEP